MLTAVTAYSNSATTSSNSPFATSPPTPEEHHTNISSESQSKLREILRDQHRRDEHKLQRNYSNNSNRATDRKRIGLHHLSSSSTIPNLHSYSSLSSPFGSGNTSPNKHLHHHHPHHHHYDASHSASSSNNIPSSSTGYFHTMGVGSVASSTGQGSVAMRRGDSADRKPSSPLPRSNTIGHSESIYDNTQYRRDTLSRQATYRMEPQQMGSTNDSMPSSAEMSRTGSSATMTNGIDIKLVILGSQGVGKTSLVHRYTSGHFSAASVPSTIGASFLTKKLIVDGVKVRLQIWDTAGQERFRSMAPMYYRGSNAAVIVYDITNPSSFEDVKTWIDELRKNVSADLVIHIVGSKLDLAAHSRKVSLEEARDKVHSWTQYQSAPINNNHLPTPSRSRSAFGALGRINTLSSISSIALPSSSSNVPLSHSSNRMTSFGGLSTIGVKSSKISPSGQLNEEENNEADGNSSPSTTSSNGNNINTGISFATPTYSRAGEWDDIEISEISSKDNEGIEDVFVGIATRLVEKKEEMEALAKSRMDRNSIYLDQDDDDDKNQQGSSRNYYSSWCCAT